MCIRDRGKELKVKSVRAFLHTYEAQAKLIKQALAMGGKASDVKAKHVLCEVRIYYNKKKERYKNNKFSVDSIPVRLLNGGNITDVNMLDLDAASDALKATNEYLAKAKVIMTNVQNRTFP